MKTSRKSPLRALLRLYRKQLQLFEDIDALRKIKRDEYIQKNLFGNPKYSHPDKLNIYEYSSFSQNGEDGIIEEIFKRIGTTNRFFVEFGVETGIECNTVYLLHKGWSGYWIDGNDSHVKSIKKNFSNIISSNRLKVTCDFITAENIEHLFKAADVPVELDLLSIDIDRNDYYVWDAIQSYFPRVVIIEYNAIFRPGCEFIVPYDAQVVWDGTSNFGASIESLYKLGLKKGYKLVACDFAGVNAFFVREDLVENKFQGPYTPENHYEPPRYFLYTKNGHRRSVVL
jgi:hypothetical protein